MYPEVVTTSVDPIPPAECRQCGSPVQRRRPSLTGVHFCTRKECQAAKQRFYYRRRQEGAATEAAELERQKAETRDNLIIAVLAEATAAETHGCAHCGRATVLPSFGHPSADWSEPCPGGGPMPFPSSLGSKIAMTLWPPS